MFSISKHLKTLLLEHNCVIVPDLGGFVAQYVPARFDAEAQKFFPPSRKVAFNADLTLNDGLLVQSLMQTYDATFPEMQKAVEDKVAAIKERLYTDGSYDLPGIGRLSPNAEGNPVFEPAADDIASPALFGLEFVEAKPARTASDSTDLTRGLIRREGGGYVVRIHRHVANAAAAAVCALFCYFNWTAPAEPQTGQPAQAKLFTTEAFAPRAAETQQAETTTTLNGGTKSATNTSESNTATSKAVPTENQTESATDKSVSEPTEAPVYTIVLAQGLNETFARQMVERLAASGATAGKAVDDGKYFSVHYSAFKSYAEAQAFLNAHRQMADFASGWVFQLP
ncbi:MAG: hypothetical protein IJS89_00195 [Bacteroidaceae bacterium]|nr:hypothetical protein [Bacteroidaceae bacterium]